MDLKKCIIWVFVLFQVLRTSLPSHAGGCFSAHKMRDMPVYERSLRVRNVSTPKKLPDPRKDSPIESSLEVDSALSKRALRESQKTEIRSLSFVDTFLSNIRKSAACKSTTVEICGPRFVMLQFEGINPSFLCFDFQTLPDPLQENKSLLQATKMSNFDERQEIKDLDQLTRAKENPLAFFQNDCKDYLQEETSKELREAVKSLIKQLFCTEQTIYVKSEIDRRWKSAKFHLHNLVDVLMVSGKTDSNEFKKLLELMDTPPRESCI